MFRILALETSELSGSVAAAADGKVLAELQLDPQQRSAQSLAPAIHSLLGQVAWQPAEIQLLAVTTGPGSFTGLRVGVATAKVLAYAIGAEILGIGTLEAIAAAAPDEVAALSVAVDAQRGDVVAQQFLRRASGWLEAVGSAALMPLEEWLSRLPPGFAVSGPCSESGPIRDPQAGTPHALRYSIGCSGIPRPPAWLGWPIAIIWPATATIFGTCCPITRGKVRRKRSGGDGRRRNRRWNRSGAPAQLAPPIRSRRTIIRIPQPNPEEPRDRRRGKVRTSTSTAIDDLPASRYAVATSFLTSFGEVSQLWHTT